MIGKTADPCLYVIPKVKDTDLKRRQSSSKNLLEVKYGGRRKAPRMLFSRWKISKMFADRSAFYFLYDQDIPRALYLCRPVSVVDG
jgi:hypothetical protein